MLLFSLSSRLCTADVPRAAHFHWDRSEGVALPGLVFPSALVPGT